MPWMNVMVNVDGGDAVHNIVNTDAIIRFGPMADGGTYIRFVDGTDIHVTDPMNEITDVVLRADEKKK